MVLNKRAFIVVPDNPPGFPFKYSSLQTDPPAVLAFYKLTQKEVLTANTKNIHRNYIFKYMYEQS